ncbi:exopolygalacturonase clone GBGE184 [Lycium ferocissimum]|uniref:exopolygalacturonase clone GBGE184 n=1 Tax=Lycium ferocissimum TaxID=112874 RepID=UPI002814A735|nr:exopolygalacturonase clone GBGE184 [Lycium ferocissimum]
MAIPKVVGFVLLLGIAIFSSKVAECAPFGSRRGLLETVFDVTKFGARPNTEADSARGFMMAWRSACQSSGPAKLVIPPGTFTTGETIFQGPCSSPRPITIEIQGTVLSATDISLYTRGAWISIEHVDGIVVTGGGTLNGQGNSSWQYADKSGSTPPLPSSLVFQTVKSSSINNINFVDSKGVHLKITDSSDITVSKIKVTAPGTSPNTDGLHISQTININVTDSDIGTGDDCIGIGDGTSNVYISNINCGPGHGISIGSLGKRLDEKDVKGIIIRNCTFHSTTNGARIKTYMGSPSLQVSDVVYEDLILDNVKNPIVIDQHYHSKGRNEPSKVKLVDIHFKNIRGTTNSKAPVALNCSEALPCDGIELVDIDLAPIGNIGSLLAATCQNAKTILGGKNNPPAC